MHINHQTKRQGDSLLVWHLNLGTSAIYSFVDVIAQGVLVGRKPKVPCFPLTLPQIYRCWVVWNQKLAQGLQLVHLSLATTLKGRKINSTL